MYFYEQNNLLKLNNISLYDLENNSNCDNCDTDNCTCDYQCDDSCFCDYQCLGDSCLCDNDSFHNPNDSCFCDYQCVMDN